MPRFTATEEFELSSILRELGVATAFDFSNDYTMTLSLPLKVEQVIHKVCIEVDEKGAVGAAVTVVACSLGSSPRPSPKVIECFRPFYFVIVGDDMGKSVFKGRVTNP